MLELSNGAALAPNTRAYIKAGVADRTRKTYSEQWGGWARWCAANNHQPLPAAPEVVADHVAWMGDAGYAPATIATRVAAIGTFHLGAGHDNPCSAIVVAKTMKGVRRTLGVAQRQATPLLLGDLLGILAQAQGQDATTLRDRALLLLGWATGLRSAELVALDTTDIAFEAGGVAVRVRRSKTDQEGQGRTVLLRDDLVQGHSISATLRHHLAAMGSDGPLFRYRNERLSTRSVLSIIKQRARAAGLGKLNYSCHSLRAGLATTCAQAGVDPRRIQLALGHADARMTGRYIRTANAWQDALPVLEV